MIQLGRLLMTVLIIGLVFTILTPLQAAEEKDTTVTAFSDLPILGMPQTGSLEQLSTRSFADQFRMLDINQDQHLNEFDFKQFQAIVEEFNANELTGLQLSTRFRNAQRNQGESFHSLYDLDRDGVFSERDVDMFSGLVNELDEGVTRGNELVHTYRMRLFPPEQPETESKE